MKTAPDASSDRSRSCSWKRRPKSDQKRPKGRISDHGRTNPTIVGTLGWMMDNASGRMPVDAAEGLRAPGEGLRAPMSLPKAAARERERASSLHLNAAGGTVTALHSKHSTAMHCTVLHYATLHRTALHCTALCYTALRYAGRRDGWFRRELAAWLPGCRHGATGPACALHCPHCSALSTLHRALSTAPVHTPLDLQCL
jgi:hypothetical protein